MAGLNIPTVIHDYNVYHKGNALIGLAGEITLPSFDSKTDTLTGSGLLGDMEEPVIGHFGTQEMEIKFRNLDDDIFQFMNPLEVVDLNLRAAQQTLDKASGSAAYRGLRIAVRGKLKKFNPGVVNQAAQMGSSITLEIMYILVEIDGRVKLELDKLNSVFKVDGTDLTKRIKQYC